MNLPINTIIQGDCLKVMKGWPSGSIDCCVTSPPYWGLRDYGVEGQLGLEKTPEEYVAKMVRIFQEVKRVLKDEGTLWLNMGDSYCGSVGSSPSNTGATTKKQKSNAGSYRCGHAAGLKPKDLCGIPWMVAFALRQDGWYLRQDIIWHKPNPMPESVRDRCTKAHEYIFLLTKKPRYYYDSEAIREDAKYGFCPTKGDFAGSIGGTHSNRTVTRGDGEGGRNKRSVWTVTTKPYSEAHFATFPPDLIEPCILAGCPEWVCPKCGKARKRIVESKRLNRTELPKDDPRYRPNTYDGAYGEINGKGDAGYKESKTTGWTDCGCGEKFQPGIVLDPFMGSGTTAMVAYENRRNYVGCELNPEYIKLNRADKAKDKYGLFEND